MILHGNLNNVFGKRSSFLYGHFIEHFHRQIYGGIYDPQSPFADEDGLRKDVISALKKIKIPIDVKINYMVYLTVIDHVVSSDVHFNPSSSRLWCELRIYHLQG